MLILIVYSMIDKIKNHQSSCKTAHQGQELGYYLLTFSREISSISKTNDY